jgi:ribonuclease HI
MPLKEKSIPHGIQLRDDDQGIIVNWYPKKGTVFAQKNVPNLNFPKVAFSKDVLFAVYNAHKAVSVADLKPTSGICSDAGTHGNPGKCEYQVADLDGNVLAHEHLGVHTNNFAELCGIVAALEYANDHKITEVWTDSDVCLHWISSGKVGETVHERDLILDILDTIQTILEVGSAELRKWETSVWGEIPADFGRKKKKK